MLKVLLSAGALTKVFFCFHAVISFISCWICCIEEFKKKKLGTSFSRKKSEIVFEEKKIQSVFEEKKVKSFSRKKKFKAFSRKNHQFKGFLNKVVILFDICVGCVCEFMFDVVGNSLKKKNGNLKFRIFFFSLFFKKWYFDLIRRGKKIFGQIQVSLVPKNRL